MNARAVQCASAAYVLKRDSANDITITQMFITLAIMLVYLDYTYYINILEDAYGC